MTTSDDLSVLRDRPFADALAKFEELLNGSARAFLIGAGCSKCAGLPLTAELTDEVLHADGLDNTSKEALAAVSDRFDGSVNANIENYLSELIDLLAIATRRVQCGATQTSIVLGTKQYATEQLQRATDNIKAAIGAIIEKKISIDIHRRFVAAVHRPLRVGKLASGQIVDYIVLNYDTAIEDALALERVSFADGMDGGATGWWSPSTFDREGLAARVLKLHGSIDWREIADDSLPRRIAKSVETTDNETHRVLIWPASTKYRETQLNPYAQLMDRARTVMRPSGGSQRVLVVCGYAFGDAHVNSEIERALRQSSGNLTVVVFTSENEPTGQMRAWTEDERIRDQVLIFANRGFFHADVSEVSKADLLWWKFENATRLIEGER